MGWVIDSTCHEFKMGPLKFKIGLGNSDRPSLPIPMHRHTIRHSGHAAMPGQVARDRTREIGENRLIFLSKTSEIGFGRLRKAECRRTPVD